MDEIYKSLPPDGHLVIPVSSRRAARVGLSMYTACKPSSRLAQRVAWHAVGLVGGWILPGRTQAWHPPVDNDIWARLTARWRDELGAFDGAVLHLRRPAYRAGAAMLLLRDSDPVAFVKLRSDRAEGLDVERRALSALADARTGFLAPAPLAAGSVEGWHYLALSALPARLHSVAQYPPFPALVDAYGDVLADVLPRATDTPPSWRPLHGDLTPWNLRVFDDGRLVLFDWEDASWAPAGADLQWYDAVVAAKGLRVRRTGVDHAPEVTAYWVARLEQVVAPGEDSMHARILQNLRTGA